jgi:hypothetical protein
MPVPDDERSARDARDEPHARDVRPAPHAPDEAPESSSRWEDLIDIYVAPAELYRRRADDRVGPPLFMLIGAAVVLYLVLLPANRLIIPATVPDDPQAAAFIEQYGTLMHALGVVMVPVTMTLLVAFGALLLWLGARLAGVTLSPARSFLISTYAGYVLLLGQVAAAVLVLLQADGHIDIMRDLSLGPLRFADVDSTSAAVPLLRRFELFALWQAALWGVGIRHVAGATAGRAALIAGGAWLLYAVPPLLFALFAPTRPA